MLLEFIVESCLEFLEYFFLEESEFVVESVDEEVLDLLLVDRDTESSSLVAPPVELVMNDRAVVANST